MYRCSTCSTPSTWSSNLVPIKELRQDKQPEFTANCWNCIENNQVETLSLPLCSRFRKINRSPSPNMASKMMARSIISQEETSPNSIKTKIIKQLLAAAPRRTMTPTSWTICQLRDSQRKIHRSVCRTTSKRARRRPKRYSKPRCQRWKDTRHKQTWPKSQNWKLKVKVTNWTRIERQFWKPNWRSHLSTTGLESWLESRNPNKSRREL